MVAAAGGCSTGLGLLAVTSATLELTGALRKKTERRPGLVCDGGRNCRRQGRVKGLVFGCCGRLLWEGDGCVGAGCSV